MMSDQGIWSCASGVVPCVGHEGAMISVWWLPACFDSRDTCQVAPLIQTAVQLLLTDLIKKGSVGP